MKDKFKTIEHKGPIFPKIREYVGYELDGKKLPYLAERQLYAYATKLDTDYVKDEVFNKNFFKCFKHDLPEEFIKNEFPADYMSVLTLMKADQEKEKELKKAEPKEVKDARKEENARIKEEYGFAIVDGKKQPLNTYILEPEGIYMGRGASPLRGMWKYALTPEDVEINYIGPKENCPKAPDGHEWKNVLQNKKSFTAGYFYINIGNYYTERKGLGFGALSDSKQKADIKKFNKAKKLSKNWDSMEKHILAGIKSKDKKEQQAALISWLILRTGIRVGTEKAEELENGVVGASQLLVKNMQIIKE